MNSHEMCIDRCGTEYCTELECLCRKCAIKEHKKKRSHEEILYGYCGYLWPANTAKNTCNANICNGYVDWLSYASGHRKDWYT